MHIPEKHVEHAFDILKSPDHAVARAAYEFAEKQLKVIFSREALAGQAMIWLVLSLFSGGGSTV